MWFCFERRDDGRAPSAERSAPAQEVLTLVPPQFDVATSRRACRTESGIASLLPSSLVTRPSSLHPQ